MPHHNMTISLPQVMFEELERVCKAENRTHFGLVQEALRQYFDNNRSRVAVPSKPNEHRDAIARRAYELWEQHGRQPGHTLEDWLQAERELNKRKGGDQRKSVTEPLPFPDRRKEDRRAA
jgi:hypothetical protein